MLVFRAVPLLDPQAASAMTASATRPADMRVFASVRPGLFRLIVTPPFRYFLRLAPPARGASQPQLFVLAARAPPPRRFRSSGAQPEALPPPRAPTDSASRVPRTPHCGSLRAPSPVPVVGHLP